METLNEMDEAINAIICISEAYEDCMRNMYKAFADFNLSMMNLMWWCKNEL
jgi:hypothetical protein